MDSKQSRQKQRLANWRKTECPPKNDSQDLLAEVESLKKQLADERERRRF